MSRVNGKRGINGFKRNRVGGVTEFQFFSQM